MLCVKTWFVMFNPFDGTKLFGGLHWGTKPNIYHTSEVNQNFNVRGTNYYSVPILPIAHT